MKTFIILCLSILISAIYADEKPKTQVVNVKIFDQFPQYNNNFEPQNGDLTEGIVQPRLDPTNPVPLLMFMSNATTTNRNGRIYSPQLFQYFFQPNQNAEGDNSGKNFPLSRDFTLTLDSNGQNYVFDNQYFFPIDNQGFDTDPNFRKYKDQESQGTPYHNFHFCLSLNQKFTYGGYETFKFIGDDDVWVFIDYQLQVDLGGLHQAKEKSVDLTKLNLIKGKVYNFDFFYCERHTSKSTIRIETSIELSCAWYDYCGVCKGDGSTCCNAKTDCDDQNLCTIDSCPDPTTVVFKNTKPSAYCNHVDLPNPYANDKCEYLAKCDPKTGQFVKNTTSCPDRKNECMLSQGCDKDIGCVYKTSCNDVCSTGKCTNGNCETKTPEMCGAEFDGKADPCFIYGCSSESNGCFKKPKCVSTNPCVTMTCSSNGTCESENIPLEKCNCHCDREPNFCEKKTCTADGKCELIKSPNIDDGNACTLDECNPDTNTTTHTPINKCSGCAVCNPKSGECSASNALCDDGNQCSDDVCVISSAGVGNCTTKSSSICDKGDICMIYTCDAEHGCNATARVCPDSGKCKKGICKPGIGCDYEPVKCTSEHFCLEAECDEKVGCVTFDKKCVAEDGRCGKGVCQNATETEEGKCTFVEYDPKPFICKTAAVVSTAVVAGVVVAGAVALGAAIFAGKKGYDYWKTSQGNTMASSNANPLYEANNNNGENPLFQSPQ